MKAVSLRIRGRLFGERGQTAVLLDEIAPAAETADTLYLRFAFVTRGREEHLFPGFLLDDWGKEVRGLKLYRWVAEFGEQFPRAEVFGSERNGLEVQFFLRELELYARLPCYAYVDRRQPLAEGVPVAAILLPEAGVAAPERRARPEGWERPLSAARVTWWRVPPALDQFDLALLAPPDPGF